MAVTLILTRHAKSAWDDPLLDDFDRPLNDRGIAAAASVGAWLAERGLMPDEVIVSGARRTVETWEGIAPALPKAPTARTDTALYHSSAATMLRVLRTGTGACLMMIGHNPGIADFAGRLARSRPDVGGFDDYPTCATGVFRFPVSRWAEVDWGQADVTGFVVPRDLT